MTDFKAFYEQFKSVEGYTGHNLLFILGAPRSGTSWLQRLIASHPQIMTTQETHVFSSYISTNIKTWEYQLDKALNDKGRGVGLPVLLTEEEFYRVLKVQAMLYLQPVFEKLQPGVYFMEKTPRHTFMIASILRLFPDAKFIHITRHPFAVTASLFQGQSWNPSWSYLKTPYHAAKYWQEFIQSFEQNKSLIPEKNLFCVRYEDLLSEPVKNITTMRDFLGLEWSDEAIMAATDKNALKSAVKNEGTELPIGGEITKRTGKTKVEESASFFSSVGKKKYQLSKLDKWVVSQMLRKEMKLYDYR